MSLTEQSGIDIGIAADIFQTAAHAAVGQLRKYTNLPYSTHPRAVAKIVQTVPDFTPEMVAAALLHDVVEDTGVTRDLIEVAFGKEVAEMVDWLTDVARPEDGNRATRVAINRAHTAKAPPCVKTIKLADLIHNGRDIEENDPNFAVVFFKEKRLLLEVLTEGDPGLFKIASDIIAAFEQKQLDKHLAAHT